MCVEHAPLSHPFPVSSTPLSSRQLGFSTLMSYMNPGFYKPIQNLRTTNDRKYDIYLSVIGLICFICSYPAETIFIQNIILFFMAETIPLCNIYVCIYVCVCVCAYVYIYQMLCIYITFL